MEKKNFIIRYDVDGKKFVHVIPFEAVHVYMYMLYIFTKIGQKVSHVCIKNIAL